MGKLKEKLLNGLTEEEQWEKVVGELSAFEYVEYMNKQKTQWVQLSLFDNEQMPTEVLEELIEEQTKLESQYYEDGWDEEMEKRYWAEQPISYQMELDEINDSIKLKYSDADVISAIKSWRNEEWLINMLLKELNNIYNLKNGLN